MSPLTSISTRLHPHFSFLQQMAASIAAQQRADVPRLQRKIESLEVCDEWTSLMCQVVVRSLNEQLEAAPTKEMVAAKDTHIQLQAAEISKLKAQLEQAKLVGNTRMSWH